MLPSEVATYTQTNSKYAQARQNDGFDYRHLTKHLVPHSRKVRNNQVIVQPHMLYCRLTRAEVNNVRSEIEKHVEGRRFTTKVYQEWKKAMDKRRKQMLYQLKMERKSGIKKYWSPHYLRL